MEVFFISCFLALIAFIAIGMYKALKQREDED